MTEAMYQFIGKLREAEAERDKWKQNAEMNHEIALIAINDGKALRARIRDLEAENAWLRKELGDKNEALAVQSPQGQ
jgi:hypothetical protein